MTTWISPPWFQVTTVCSERSFRASMRNTCPTGSIVGRRRRHVVGLRARDRAGGVELLDPRLLWLRLARRRNEHGNDRRIGAALVHVAPANRISWTSCAVRLPSALSEQFRPEFTTSGATSLSDLGTSASRSGKPPIEIASALSAPQPVSAPVAGCDEPHAAAPAASRRASTATATRGTASRATDPAHAGIGRGCRTMPRASRSSCITRAAATRSGSREIVRASQSM